MSHFKRNVNLAARYLRPVALGCAIALAGAAWLSLEHGSPPADADLLLLIVALAAFIFLVVEGLLIFSAIRTNPAALSPGRHVREVVWTATPALILIGLLGFTLQTVAAGRSEVAGDPMRVRAIGRQFFWEFEYLDLGIVTATDLVVPRGAAVEVQVETADIAHGFWAPGLFGRVDALPGIPARVSFSSAALGATEFGGQCTVVCGLQHAQMRFSVIVLPPEEFRQWAAANRAPAAQADGEQLFRQQCAGCHAVRGVAEADNLSGPDLTHVASRRTLAGGILENNPQNLLAWLRDPQQIKPGSKMTGELSEADVQTLAAYLWTLK